MDDEPLNVRCIRCHGEAILAPGNPRSWLRDREAWEVVDCFFLEDCKGKVYPEPIH